MAQAATQEAASDPKVGSITVQGLEFEVDYPYVAGTTDLTAGEASALNQTRAENLRNNFAARIKAGLAEYRKTNNLAEDAEVAVTVLDKDQLDKEWADYAGKYEFGVRQLGSGLRTPTDPVEREAHKIATAKVKEALAKANMKLASVTKEQMAELVKATIIKYPDIMAEAKRRVEAVGEIVIADLAPAA